MEEAGWRWTLGKGADYGEIEAAFVADPRHELAARDLSRSWSPLMDADPWYLAAMFDAVASQRGSVAGYFSADLGIDAGAVGALRAQLLE